MTSVTEEAIVPSGYVMSLRPRHSVVEPEEPSGASCQAEPRPPTTRGKRRQERGLLVGCDFSNINGLFSYVFLWLPDKKGGVTSYLVR